MKRTFTIACVLISGCSAAEKKHTVMRPMIEAKTFANIKGLVEPTSKNPFDKIEFNIGVEAKW